MGSKDGKPVVEIDGILVDVVKFDSRDGEVVKNIIRIDAPNPQAYPQTFAINSQRQICQIGERAEVKAVMNGRRNRNFHNIDLWEQQA